VNVRFTVQPPAATPTIVLSSTSQEFNAVEGGPNPDPQTVEVTNGGGGTLDGLSQNITYIVGSPSDPVDWLTAALSATAAPSTLTLTVATAGLAAGTYRANVFVSSDAASNSAQPVSVVFNVTPQTIPNAPSNLEATVVSTSQIDLQWTDNADNEEGFRVDLCFDPVCGNFSQEVVGPNVTVYESKGLGQATTYHFRVQAFISGGNSAYSEIVSATTLSAWTTKTPMPTPRYLSASGVVDGVLYVVGGLFGELATNEAYNPGNDTWSPKAPIPTPRAGATAAVVNGILYVVGGLRDGVELATVEAYDPLTDDWTTKAPMPTARDGAMAGVVDGIIYVAGGTGEPGTGFLATVEAYDPGTDSWTTVAPLSQGRTFGAVGVVDGILYVAGGDAGGADPATTEAYDPTTDSWTTKAIIPTQRDRVASAVLDGILYVAAGAAGGGSEVLATVEAYDPGTDDWTTKPAMPTAREFPVAGVVNGVLYVVGGRAGNGSALGTVEAYSP
jgi:N-acetylneuraminic acid mutarotase